MNQSNKIAEERILAPADLTEQHLQQTLDLLMVQSVDMAELYFQNSTHESWLLEDGIVKEGSRGLEQGVGVRAISGEKTGFAYSDEIHLDALKLAATSAKAIANRGQSARVQAWKRPDIPVLYDAINPLHDLSDSEKVQLMEAANAEARRLDSRIQQVFVNLAALQDVVLVCNSDGTLAADTRPLVRMNITVIAEQNGRREQGSFGGGGRFGYSYFVKQRSAEAFAGEAVREALINLEAEAAPAGEMTVVLGPGWPGILLHEAIGHGLEGDFNRKGTSAFAGRIGERVASSLCTVVDNGTMPNLRGSLSIDVEGTPSQSTVLIEDGILKGYMQDKLNSRLMNVSATGNGRRESYAHLPMPRMTNTYMQPGQHEPGEIIASVKKGLYAVDFGGGQVDITSGKFVFSASEAYLIENGKVGKPVKGATLIGNGPDVLTKVSMVGNDLALDNGIGTCGKEGQSVPVGVGQPTVKIDRLTVGGTSTI